MKKYVLVQWPESQELMEHPRFNECLLVQDLEGHEEVGSSAYMCPEDLWYEIHSVNTIEHIVDDYYKLTEFLNEYLLTTKLISGEEIIDYVDLYCDGGAQDKVDSLLISIYKYDKLRRSICLDLSKMEEAYKEWLNEQK